MGYLVLARKWRPQTFDDVVGQDHIISTLKNTIKSNRVAHAYIFGGQRGVGKTSVARIFAKALNCLSGPTEFPCNVCANCVEISEGFSLDCREIDGASNRGIEEIRDLKENIKFAPISSRYKINIIDEVHMLSREAFNALLKTLEEPPAHVVFIFATTEIRKIPATIISRCQYYDFRRLGTPQLIASLRQIAKAESITVSDNALAMIAAAGDGSMRDVQSIFDQVISFAGREIEEREVAKLLGIRDRRFLFELSQAVFAHDAGRCLAIIEETYYSGADLHHFYHLLLQHFRNFLLCKIVEGSAASTLISADDLEEYRECVRNISVETLQRYLDILLLEEESVTRGSNPRLGVEMVVLRMALLEPLIPLESFVRRLEGIERGLRGENAAPGAMTGANTTDATLASAGKSPLPGAAAEGVETLGESSWEVFLKGLRGKNESYWRWLRYGRFVERIGDAVNIAVAENHIVARSVAEIFAKEEFVKIFAEFFGFAPKLYVVQQPSGDAPAALGVRGEAALSPAEKVALEESPTARKIFAAYPDAKVVEVRRRE